MFSDPRTDDTVVFDIITAQFIPIEDVGVYQENNEQEINDFKINPNLREIHEIPDRLIFMYTEEKAVPIEDDDQAQTGQEMIY
jgi:hypothetical protein